MVCARNAAIPLAGLLIGSPMRKLRFALLSVVFIALALGIYALQAGAALYQWLTGRTRRTFRISLLGPRRAAFRITLVGPRGKRSPKDPEA
jgi:hypothetical protein